MGNQVIQEDAKVCQMSTFRSKKRFNGINTSGEEKKTTSQNKMDMVVPGKRRRGGLDGDGSTTSGKI